MSSRGESALVSRNIVIGGHRTSIRLEPELWEALKTVSQMEGQSVNELCSRIANNDWREGGFTSAVRVFVVKYFLQRVQGWRSQTDEAA